MRCCLKGVKAINGLNALKAAPLFYYQFLIIFTI